MEESDVERVAEIHVSAWRNAFFGILSNDFLFNRLRVQSRVEIYRKSLISKETETYVFDDGMIKAFMTIGRCRDDDKPDSFELWGLYVDPFWQHSGIGKLMSQFCEQEAISRKYDDIYLWVLEPNLTARNFYRKMGYIPDGSMKEMEWLHSNEIRYFKRLEMK
jgi:ribosomal protein S18 acetylase RimI-like enzyme